MVGWCLVFVMVSEAVQFSCGQQLSIKVSFLLTLVLANMSCIFWVILKVNLGGFGKTLFEEAPN